MAHKPAWSEGKGGSPTYLAGIGRDWLTTYVAGGVQTYFCFGDAVLLNLCIYLLIWGQ